jgi:hypothetical protein
LWAAWDIDDMASPVIMASPAIFRRERLEERRGEERRRSSQTPLASGTRRVASSTVPENSTFNMTQICTGCNQTIQVIVLFSYKLLRVPQPRCRKPPSNGRTPRLPAFHVAVLIWPFGNLALWLFAALPLPTRDAKQPQSGVYLLLTPCIAATRQGP